MAPSDFSVSFDIHARCVGCERERGLSDGAAMILQSADGNSDMVVRDLIPCDCGESRVRLSVGLDYSA
jgi:hypothetical protein